MENCSEQVKQKCSFNRYLRYEESWVLNIAVLRIAYPEKLEVRCQELNCWQEAFAKCFVVSSKPSKKPIVPPMSLFLKLETLNFCYLLYFWLPLTMQSFDKIGQQTAKIWSI